MLGFSMILIFSSPRSFQRIRPQSLLRRAFWDFWTKGTSMRAGRWRTTSGRITPPLLSQLHSVHLQTISCLDFFCHFVALGFAGHLVARSLLCEDSLRSLWSLHSVILTSPIQARFLYLVHSYSVLQHSSVDYNWGLLSATLKHSERRFCTTIKEKKLRCHSLNM